MSELVPFKLLTRPVEARRIPDVDLAARVIEGEYIEAYPVWPVWHMVAIVAMQVLGVIALAVWVVAK